MMAVKLDMSKAYDRIKWDFVIGTHEAMELSVHMIHLIKLCISLFLYQVLVNRQPSHPFYPHRGLRQGDPLSPYMFIICVDVLSGLLKREIQTRNIHDIQVARKAPVISHLFFADDSLVFARANSVEVAHILDVLSIYQQASDQVVNVDKSKGFFSKNLGSAACEEVCNSLGMWSVASPRNYLGLPIILGRSKKQIFR